MLLPAGDCRAVLWSCAALGRFDLPLTENDKPDQFGDIVFLVHGVGSAEPGALAQEARPVLQPFSILQYTRDFRFKAKAKEVLQARAMSQLRGGCICCLPLLLYRDSASADTS